MSNDNPNAQVEANLLEGKNRYASAAATLQDIKKDLDSIAAGLQSSWLGGASQDYQDKQGKLTTTVNTASDVLQKGSTSIGKMHDSYIEADEKQKQAQEDMQIFMGVFMIVTAFFGVISPILEAADVVFAVEIDALDIAVDVGDVTTEVAGDTSIADTTLVDPGEGSIDDINVPDEVTSPGNDPSTVSDGTTTPVDPIPPEDPATPPPNGETPPSDAPVEPPSDAPVEPPSDTPVDPPNGDGAPEETTPEASNRDSGIDLSQDQQDLLDKILNEPTVSDAPKEIAPPNEPVQVNMTQLTGVDDPVSSMLPPAEDPTVSFIPNDTVIAAPQQESFADPLTGNTTVVNIDTAGNETITVTDANGNTTFTEPDPLTGETQTTEIFTDANGNTTVTNTTIAVDRAYGDVIETETVIDPNGNETITETVTTPDGNQDVTEFQPDGTVTTTETWTDGAQRVTEFQPDGTVTTTNTEPDGTVVESGSYPDRTEVTEVTQPNGDTTLSVSETVDDPQTGQSVQIKTTTNTETDSQGLSTVTKIVEDPLKGTQTITETVNNADGSQTVTTIVTDMSRQNVISVNEQTIPPAGSTAGPSTASTSAGPSKRPFPDDDGSPGVGPSTKKLKGKDPIR